MRGGRGQVTAFFLIGLAIVIVFIIVLLLRRSLIDRSEPVSVEDAVARGYIEQCVDLASERAFLQLGLQGGVLLESQGGLTPTDDSRLIEIAVLDAAGNPTQERVHVGRGLATDIGSVRRPPGAAEFAAEPHSSQWGYDPASENPYPWPGITLAALSSGSGPLAGWNDKLYDGAFGQRALPPTCDPEGANNGESDVPRCPTLLFGEGSMQESLADAIAYGISNCIDEDALSERLGGRMSVEEPSVNVSLMPGRTIVKAEVPLRFASEEAAFAVSSFERDYDVRVLRTAYFALHLLNATAKDPYFRIDGSASYRSVIGYDSFAVRREPILPSQAGGRKGLSLVAITDTKSRVDDNQWTFQFVMEDRAPVLDRIPDASETDAITFIASDPDGDNLVGELYLENGGAAPTSVAFSQQPDGTGQATQTLAAGTYNFSVSDPAGLSDWQVFEVVAAAPTPLPDLTVELKDAFGSGVPDHNSGVELSICNVGSVEATIPAGSPLLSMGESPNLYNIYNFPYSSPDSYAPDPGTSSSSTAERTIPANTCLDVCGSDCIPQLVYEKYGFSGTGVLMAIIDPTDAVQESEESNNEHSKSYP